MTSPENLPHERPTRVRWVVFSLAFITSGMLYLHRYIFAFIKPTLADEWGLSKTELGKMDSAFAFFYAGCQVPLAVLADVFGVRLILPCLLLVWCAGLAVMRWAPSTYWMWIGQATLGTGQSAVFACLNRIGRIWYPPTVQTTMQGAVGVLAGRLGALCSSLVFTSLLLGVLGLPWRTAIAWMIALGLVQMVVFAVTFRNHPREHPAVNEAEARLIEGPERKTAQRRRMNVREMFRAMSRRSILNLVFLMVQSTLSTIADNIYSNWIPLFLAQVHHLEFKQMGIYAAMPLLGGALAGLAGGVLNDFLISRTGNRRWSRVAVAFVGKGMAAVLLLAALGAYDRPQLFCVCLFFVKFFGDWSLTTSWGVVSDIGGRATASVFALNNAVAGIGLIIAPILFGSLADNYGWPTVFVCVAATNALCACSWFAIDCTIPVLKETDESADSPAG